MARNLTDKGVAALKPKKSIYHQRDPLMSGHFIRMRPTGSKQFVAMTRNPNGKQVWNTLGTFPLMPNEDARAKAKDIINCLKVGSASRDLRRLRQSQMNGLSAMSKPGGFSPKEPFVATFAITFCLLAEISDLSGAPMSPSFATGLKTTRVPFRRT